jgi:hypothetical protein
MKSIKSKIWPSEKRRQKSPAVVGVEDALRAYDIEIGVVHAPQFNVLEPYAGAEDVERDIQDVVRFVIGQMPLESMAPEVDVADPHVPLGKHECCADAASTEALDTISQVVLDAGRSHHGPLALWLGSIHDAAKDSPPALVEDSAVAFPCLVEIKRNSSARAKYGQRASVSDSCLTAT